MMKRSLVCLAVLVLGLAGSAWAVPSGASANGSVWFTIPADELPPLYPNGVDVHVRFNIQSFFQFGLGIDRGHVHMSVFDRSDGKLIAVLAAVKQEWPEHKKAFHIWNVTSEDGGLRFWVEFEIKSGWFPAGLLGPWTLWVGSGGRGQVSLVHGAYGPYDASKGNVRIHGI